MSHIVRTLPLAIVMLALGGCSPADDGTGDPSAAAGQPGGGGSRPGAGGGAGTSGANGASGTTSAGAAGASSSGGTAGAQAAAGAAAAGSAGQGGGGGGGGSGGLAGGGGGVGGAGGSAAVGGSGGSAGNAGAGGGSAGAGPVGNGCGTKPYKLCEDFEAATPGALPPGWEKFELYQQGKPGTVDVQTDQFHGGAKALKSSSAAKDQPRARRSLASLGTLANNHWGRIWYKVQTPAPRPNTYFHVTFAALTKSDKAPESRIVDNVQDPTGKLQYLYNLPDDTCCTMTGFSGAFDDKWHCAEWFISQSTNAYRFFLDSKEVAISFTGNTKARIANIDYIALGTAFYQLPATPFVAWIDDLVLNDTQVGCNPCSERGGATRAEPAASLADPPRRARITRLAPAATGAWEHDAQSNHACEERRPR